MPDDTDIEQYMQRLIAMITADGMRLMTQDPKRFHDALKRADVDHHLRRLSDVARDMSALAPSPPVAALTPAPAAIVGTPEAVWANGAMHTADADPLADFTKQHLSTIREVIILLLAIQKNGGATFATVRDATAPFWKGEGDISAREKALRTQISRMGDYITSRGDGTYRVTELGRKRLVDSCDINAGLIRRVHPDIIEQAERVRRDAALQ